MKKTCVDCKYYRKHNDGAIIMQCKQKKNNGYYDIDTIICEAFKQKKYEIKWYVFQENNKQDSYKLISNWYDGIKDTKKEAKEFFKNKLNEKEKKYSFIAKVCIPIKKISKEEQLKEKISKYISSQTNYATEILIDINNIIDVVYEVEDNNE